LIYDAGAIKAQQQVQQLQAKVEDGKVEVELYKLKERVTQIFVAILYLDAQAAQLNLVEADLNIGLKKLTAQVEQGVAYRSNLNTIKAELLKLQQRKIELAANRTGLIDVLGLFMHQSLPASQAFKKPATIEKENIQIQRPELTLFAQQSKLALQQLQMIQAKNMPKAALFVQGGYGRPGLNMLKNSFEWFGIGGVKLSWSLGAWYTAPREKKIVQLQSDAIQIQQATFLLQTATQQQQQLAEIKKLQQLIGTDREIIELRESIRTAAEAQLQNGVITANDYLREVNAADQARQTMLTHDIQLMQAQLNLQLINGR
jgi:outer membrane protein TolC